MPRTVGTRRRVTLTDAATFAGWATPRANEATGSKIPPVLPGGMALKTQAQMTSWPTPAGRDYKSDKAQKTDAEMYGTKGRPLSGVAYGATEPARLLGSGGMLTGSSARILMAPDGGQLNPSHSRWLQAYPEAFERCHPNYADWRKWQDWTLRHSLALKPTAPAP